MQLTLALCLWLAAGGTIARAASPPPAAQWFAADPPADGSFVGADGSGFWTQNGSHYRLDGKRDLALKLPAALHHRLGFARSGPDGPVVAGSVEEGTGAARVAAYDPSGNERWSLSIGGDYGKDGNTPNSAGTDGLFVNPNGDVVLAGHFSGCVRFAGGGKGKRTCVDEKAAQRFDNGSCDPCTQAFVAVYDARGKLRSVFAPPGYPASFFAAAPDGRIALAGGWDASLDLDPDPDPARAAVVNQPGNPKPRRGDLQAFWSIFDGRNRMQWLGGKALTTPRGGSAYPIGTAFDGDGALVTVVHVQLGRRPRPCAVTDGTLTTDVRAEHGDHVVVTLDAKDAKDAKKGAPAADLLAADKSPASSNAPTLRLLSSPTGGLFAFGALVPPVGTRVIEPPQPHRRQLVLVGLRGTARGLAIGVPEELFVPEAVLVEKDGVCVAFTLVAQHEVASGGGTITLGEPHVVGQTSPPTRAIGCFR
ncbi:MAG TPA: hypothetical protein VIF57_23800 [Polyangia bacterium]|jgi:hypothetical protein